MNASFVRLRFPRFFVLNSAVSAASVLSGRDACHQPHQRILRGGARGSSPAIRPSRNTMMRVERCRTSGQLARDQEDARARRRELVDERVDLRLGADVDAAGRLVEDQDAAARRQPLGEHDLLLVAARQAGGDDVEARARARAAARSTCRASARSAPTRG